MRLVVVAGEANTGKLATMWALAARDPGLRVLHRDQIRIIPGRAIDEWHLTLLIADMARSLLSRGYSVITVGQNQCEADKGIWRDVAYEAQVALEWVDTAEVDVDALVAA